MNIKQNKEAIRDIMSMFLNDWNTPALVNVCKKHNINKIAKVEKALEDLQDAILY